MSNQSIAIVPVDEPDDECELESFLDREWEAWHASQEYDGAVDWSGSVVRLVARQEDGRIAGAAVGRVRAGVGHLSELMVTDGLRRQGIGARLVRQFERNCQESGCHKLTVHTDARSPARKFYNRLGWCEEALFRRDRGGRDFVRLYKYIDNADH